MALNYLTGRLSRLALGYPGLSTVGNLTLDISGAVGVDTRTPRAEADFPNVSVRGDVVDSVGFTGGIGYFLSQDVNGVRWVEAPPIESNAILILENGSIVGAGSFIGINFVAEKDPDFISVIPDPLNPQLARVSYDIRWVRKNFGANKGISTGFGNGGTYASIPGFGTTEAVGVTSVGIGTDNPQDDFQVGIGSTGVTINGPLGLVDAEIIKANSISVEGNLEVESLIVRPGVATLTTLEVLNEAFIPVEYVGYSSIKEANIEFLFAEKVLAGLTTLGFGGEDVFVLNDLFVQGGLGTFSGDVFVGGDLTVRGETFFNQINAVNLAVSGVATINQAEINTGIVTNLIVSGFTTLTDYSFNIGVGTYLELEDLNTSGVGSFGFIDAGDGAIGGGLTVGEIDADKGFIGILTADSIVSQGGTIGSIESDGNLTQLNDIIVGGASTFVGLGTFLGDLYVGEDLFVNGDVTFRNINGEQLLISGVGTVNNLVFDVGIGTYLALEDLEVTGFATIRAQQGQTADIRKITSEDVVVSSAATINVIDVNEGRVGFLTGTDLDYTGVGTINQIDVNTGRVGLVTGDTLLYYEQSRINKVVFFDDYLSVNQNIIVAGLSTFVGTGTFFNDLYVGGDLFVAGELNFKQLNGENLYLTGVGTIYDLRNTVGFITNLYVEESVTGLATINSLVGNAATITDYTGESLLIENPGNPMPFDPTGIPGFAVIDQLVIRNGNVQETLIANNIDAGFTDTNDLNVSGVGTINTLEWNDATGDSTDTNDLIVNNEAVINIIDANQIDSEDARLGVVTITNSLNVVGPATFQGKVTIEDFAFINQEVTGISSINILKFNVGYGTYLEVTESVTGVSTIGLASITNAEVSFLDVRDEKVGASTIGVLSVTEALAVTGPSTFVGFTTMSGDLFVDGNLTVTGFVSFTQLNADQSQIGILTVFDALDASTAIGTFKHLETVDSAILSGVSTIGLSTFKNGDVEINRNLTVGGITTFLGNVHIEETEFVELSVTNQANINKLFVNSGIATQFSIGVATITQSLTGIATVGDLNVTGLSTFVGFSTFNSSVNISDDLIVGRNVSVGSGLTVPTLNFVRGIGRSLSLTEEIVGTSTITNADITSENVDDSNILRAYIRDLEVTGFSTFRGFATFDDSVFVSGRVDANEFVAVSSVTAPLGQFDRLNVNDADIGNATVGFATITELFTEDLQVVGTSTFIGFSTFLGDVFVNGNLTVTGVTTFRQLDAEQSQIGILTVFNYLENQGDLSVAGFSTLGDFQANSGVVTSISSGEIDVTGDVSIGGTLGVSGVAGFSSNFYTVGITTLASGRGIVTTGGDLYVGGNLFVYNDIEYDEIIGRNLDISGIATIADLRAGIGSIADLRGTTLRYQTGIITTLRAETAEIGRYIGTSINVTDLRVVGPSTFVGVGTFGNDLFVKDDLSVLANIRARDIFVDNSVNGTTLDFDNGTIDDLISQYILTDDANVTGFLTATGVQASFINVLGVTTSPIIVSDQITNSGLVTTGTLFVQTLARVNQLIVDDQSIFNGTALFNDLVTIDNDLLITGDAVVTDLSATNGFFAGILTATDTRTNRLTVNGSFGVTGVATFFSGLRVAGAPLFVDNQLFANQGFVTSISGDTLNYTNGTFTEDLQVVKDLSVNGNINNTGFTTTINLDVTAQIETPLLSVTGIATIPTLYSNNIFSSGTVFANNLRFNTGFGTYLQVTDLAVTGVATIPTLNIDYLTADQAQIGILTVTQQLDHSDVVSTDVTRTTTSSTALATLISLPPSYKSAEFTITAEGLTDIHSAKIHAAMKGGSVYWNEYSSVFSNSELGEFDVVDSAGFTQLKVTPASAGITTFTVYSVAHR